MMKTSTPLQTFEPVPFVREDQMQPHLPVYRIRGFSESYTDYLALSIDIVQHQLPMPTNKRKGPRGGVIEPFPQKLYEMLSAMEAEGLQHVAAWRSHGRCFEMTSPQAFVAAVLPRFFKQTKMTSFQRQLNLYGFQKITAGPDKGCYCHPIFLRGRPELCKIMIRTPIKRHGQKVTQAGGIPCQSLYDLPKCPTRDHTGPHERRREQSSFIIQNLELTNDPLIEGLLTVLASEGGNAAGKPNLVRSDSDTASGNGRVTPEQGDIVTDEEGSDSVSDADPYEGIIPMFQGDDSWEKLGEMFETV